MKIETKEIYKCDFCKKFYLRKGACTTHEKRCNGNPDNFRPCFGCEHLEMRNVYLYEDDPRGLGEIKRKVKALYCNHKKVNLTPPIAIHKGHAYDFGDEGNEPMPKDCKVRCEPIRFL